MLSNINHEHTKSFNRAVDKMCIEQKFVYHNDIFQPDFHQLCNLDYSRTAVVMGFISTLYLYNQHQSP